MCDMCCTFLCNEYLGYTYLLMRQKDKKWDSVSEDFDFRICITSILSTSIVVTKNYLLYTVLSVIFHVPNDL